MTFHVVKAQPTPASFAAAAAFRHNPYGNGKGSLLFLVDEKNVAEMSPSHAPPQPPAPAPIMESPLPPSTRHVALHGRVAFFPYPTEPFYLPETSHVPAPGEPTVRVFMGQLPYEISAMQLQWLCYNFGGGHVVSNAQRIVKRQPRGAEGVERLPSGCIHAECGAAAVPHLAGGMHKRLLIDDTGVWFARSAEEMHQLSLFVQQLKTNRRNRPSGGLPYDSVVVQPADSVYNPPNPSWIATNVFEQFHADMAARHAAPARSPAEHDSGAESMASYGADGHAAMDDWRC